MSRRASVGVPIGVAALIVAAVLGGVMLRGEGGRPPALPLSLTSGGEDARAEAASDAKLMAGSAPHGGATYRFVGPVPSGLPDESTVYELDDAAPAKADVRRLAEVLGVDGDITAEQDALVIRDGEWVLRVSTTPSRMWSYYREVLPTCEPLPAGAEPALAEEHKKRCGAGMPVDDGGSGGAAGICLEGADSPCTDTPETSTSAGTASSDQAVMSCPEPAPCPPDAKCATIVCAPYEEPKPLPLGPESEARRVAQRVFDAAGIGTAATLMVNRGFDAWYINAAVKVAGLEVMGLGHSVTVDADGRIREASGSLATADVLDTYPLVSPRAGLDRLEKQYGDVRTLMLCAPDQPDCNGSAEPVVLDVTGVRLGLLFSPIWENERERVYLVPAWVYEIKGRDYPEWVMAIPDEYLKAVTPEQPPGEVVVDPAPPVDSGSGGGSAPNPGEPGQVEPGQPGPDQPATTEPAPEPSATTEAGPAPSATTEPAPAEPAPSPTGTPSG